MASVDKITDDVLVQRELVRSAKHIAGPFETAYQWLTRQDLNLDRRETVGTIAFSGKGRNKVSHVTWSELVDIHKTFERLDRLERLLKVRWEQQQDTLKSDQGDANRITANDNSEGGIG